MDGCNDGIELLPPVPDDVPVPGVVGLPGVGADDGSGSAVVGPDVLPPEPSLVPGDDPSVPSVPGSESADDVPEVAPAPGALSESGTGLPGPLGPEPSADVPGDPIAGSLEDGLDPSGPDPSGFDPSKAREPDDGSEESGAGAGTPAGG